MSLLILLLSLVAWNGSVPTARATASDSAKIPANSLGCTLCHAGPSASVDYIPPGGSESLTNFGEDWLSLGVQPSDRTWSKMAALNSDTDGCSNGYEMGDPDGDGLNLEPRSHDPNVQDCTLPLDENSWGNLKSLFEN